MPLAQPWNMVSIFIIYQSLCIRRGLGHPLVQLCPQSLGESMSMPQEMVTMMLKSYLFLKFLSLLGGVRIIFPQRMEVVTGIPRQVSGQLGRLTSLSWRRLLLAHQQSVFTYCQGLSTHLSPDKISSASPLLHCSSSHLLRSVFSVSVSTISWMWTGLYGCRGFPPIFIPQTDECSDSKFCGSFVL